jgi:uncharacterized protein YjbI with pentapeptide repeats
MMQQNVCSRVGLFWLRVVLALALCVSILGCGSTEQPAGRCAGLSRNYASLTGSELCDTQHLAATLAPRRADPAGVGALQFALRVTRSESRDYCFKDDDGERHKLSLRDGAGRILADMIAGDACRRLSLEPGVYVVRLEHEQAGGEGGTTDVTPDTVHTALIAPSGQPTLLFQVNACEGCNLKDVGSWPCYADLSTRTSYCGFRGNYRNASIGGICEQTDASFLPGGELFPVECVLEGDFSNADLTGTVVGFPGRDPFTGRVQGSSTLRGTFKGTRFPERFQFGSSHEVLFNVTELSGSVPDMKEWTIVNESPRAVLDYGFMQQFNRAAAFRGRPAVFQGRGGFVNQVFDFARVDIQPLGPNGEVNFENLNFSGSTLRNVRPPSAQPHASYNQADFSRTVIEDSVFGVSSLINTDFVRATLRNVTFKPDPNVVVPTAGINLFGSDLSQVQFGDANDATSVLRFDLSNVGLSGVTMRDVTFAHTRMRGSRWDNGTTVEGLTLWASDLTDSTFDLQGFDRVNLSYSTFAPRSFRVGSAVPALFGLTARGAYIKSSMRNWTFTQCNLEEATLDGDATEAQFFRSDLDRAVLGCLGAGCTSSFVRARFEDTSMNGAHLYSNMQDARFKNVVGVGATFRADMNGVSFDGGSLNGAHFCGPGGVYVGMSFSNLPMAGAVMPELGSTFPNRPLQPGEDSCAGAIPSVQRDLLATSQVFFCPNGAPPRAGDCRGAEWDVSTSANVRPVCCTPARDSSCRPLLPGGPCTADCQCASQSCGPDLRCR